jgi:hypothetical protein
MFSFAEALCDYLTLLPLHILHGPINSIYRRCRDNSIMHVRLLCLAGLSTLPLLTQTFSIAVTGAVITGTYALAKRRGQVVASIYAASAALNCGIAGATFFSMSTVCFLSVRLFYTL